MRHSQSQKKGEDGVGVMFETMVQSPVGIQIIEPAIFDVPSAMPDEANVGSGHFGLWKSGEPIPLVTDGFLHPFSGDASADRLGFDTPHHSERPTAFF